VTPFIPEDKKLNKLKVIEYKKPVTYQQKICQSSTKIVITYLVKSILKYGLSNKKGKDLLLQLNYYFLLNKQLIHSKKYGHSPDKKHGRAVD